MKFGRAEEIDKIDFKLPSEPEENSHLDFHNNQITHLYLGATGWSMPEWKGVIYPEKSKSVDFLSYYSRQFNAIELNSTHYRIPKAEVIEKWKANVPKDFKFCPKVWQNISHRKNLGIGTGYIQEFTDMMSIFNENLGPSFIQLPPYFDFTRLDLLAECISRFPKGFEIAIEVRHESFFTPENKAEFFRRLAELNSIAVITDVAGRRDILHSRLTYPKAFIRWVGNGLHKTDYSRLQEWYQRLYTWAENGISEIYFFPHQPDNLLTPQISSYFCKQFESVKKISSRAPVIMKQNDQLKLF